MPVAIFGIEDGSLNLVINLLILFLVVVWLALVYWTWADARRRISDPVLVATATAAALIPFLGTMVYSILRPPEFLEDAHERELEIRASELRLRQLTESSCPRCSHPIERNWLRCPECRAHLKDPCRSCNRAVDPRWAICPHCETPLPKRERQPSGREGGRRRPRPAERSGGTAPRGDKRRAEPKPASQGGGERPTQSRERGEPGETREPRRRPPSPQPRKAVPDDGSGRKAAQPDAADGAPRERPPRRRPTTTG